MMSGLCGFCAIVHVFVLFDVDGNRPGDLRFAFCEGLVFFNGHSILQKDGFAFSTDCRSVNIDCMNIGFYRKNEKIFSAYVPRDA